VQGNVEDMTTRSLKPSRQSAELVVMLEQQDRMSMLCQAIGTRQPPKTTPYDNNIIEIINSTKGIPCHTFGGKRVMAFSANPNLEEKTQAGLKFMQASSGKMVQVCSSKEFVPEENFHALRKGMLEAKKYLIGESNA
tara:strand:- start:159 stop:569 length:411 start_codon:yes stop_codon:yes gene_type:complete